MEFYMQYLKRVAWITLLEIMKRHSGHITFHVCLPVVNYGAYNAESESIVSNFVFAFACVRPNNVRIYEDRDCLSLAWHMALYHTRQGTRSCNGGPHVVGLLNAGCRTRAFNRWVALGLADRPS